LIRALRIESRRGYRPPHTSDPTADTLFSRFYAASSIQARCVRTAAEFRSVDCEAGWIQAVLKGSYIKASPMRIAGSRNRVIDTRPVATAFVPRSVADGAFVVILASAA
jgi:hypothetical protein